ncbi:MAG: hypothetical protein FK734_14345 [Asgard group archaeon]|nr:hypothetical protein [Asgard group archaeon]
MEVIQDPIIDNPADEAETNFYDLTHYVSDLLELEKQIPRKIIAGEIDKLTHIFSCTTDQQINCVLTLDGHLDIPRLKKAITLTFYAEPVLGSRFIVLPDEVYWQRRDDVLDNNFCPIEQPKNLDNAINNFVTSTIDSRVDFPLRIKIFRMQEYDTLCLKVGHEVLDGGGIQDYLSLLTSFYRTLNQNPTFLPQPNTENDRSLKQVFKRLNIFRKIATVFQLRIRTPNMTFPWESLEAKTRKYKIHRIAKESYLKLKEFSKKMKVTITDLIVTAYFRAMARLTELTKKKPLISTYTVNLRVYMPNYKAKSLCNLTTASHPQITYKPEESFLETLKQVHKSTQKLKRKGPGLEAALFCRLLFSMPYVKSKEILEKTINEEIHMNATFPIISNIGLVESKDINFGANITATDGYIITPFMKAPGFLMGTITFNDSLIFSMGYFEESYATVTISHFLEMLEEELLSSIVN